MTIALNLVAFAGTYLMEKKVFAHIFKRTMYGSYKPIKREKEEIEYNLDGFSFEVIFPKKSNHILELIFVDPLSSLRD